MALDEVTAGGGYRLWSIVPTPSNGRAKTYVAIPDGRGDGGGGRCRTVANYLSYLRRPRPPSVRFDHLLEDMLCSSVISMPKDQGNVNRTFVLVCT